MYYCNIYYYALYVGVNAIIIVVVVVIYLFLGDMIKKLTIENVKGELTSKIIFSPLITEVISIILLQI